MGEIVDIKKNKKLSNISYEEWAKKEYLYCQSKKERFNKKVGLKNLITTKNILDEENITFWLAFGTLLGAYRDNDFIEWDDDVDIIAYSEDIYKKYDILKDKFISNSFIFRDCNKDKGIKLNLYRHKQLFTIDSLALNPKYENNKYRISNKWQHPRKYFENYGTIEFKGMIFRVPTPVEEYLSFLYKNWKIPILKENRHKDKKWRNKKIYQNKILDRKKI